MSSTLRPEPTTGRNRLQPAVVMQLIALTPLWVLLLVSVASGGALPSLAGAPTRIAGVPLEAALSGLAMLWTLAGLLVVSKVGSSIGQAMAVLVFTIPATILVVLAPASSLIAQTAT